VDASFSDVVFTQQPSRLIMVIKGSSTSSAQIRYLSVLVGFADDYNFRTSSNSGSSWSSINSTMDMPFFVYGRYEYPSTTNVNVDTYNLASVRVSLQPGTAADTAMNSGVETLNKPSCPAP
jgi:hypothetical protein